MAFVSSVRAAAASSANVIREDIFAMFRSNWPKDAPWPSRSASGLAVVTIASCRLRIVPGHRELGGGMNADQRCGVLHREAARRARRIARTTWAKAADKG